MKSFLLRCVESMLRIMAIVVLKRHRPIVLGITGSVGKSSTKEAIATVLSARFRVRQSPGNFNNEIGIPLTIIGSLDTKRSRFRLVVAPFRFFLTLCLPHSRYPEILILELGIDRIGDMEYLLEFLSPVVGVLTTISTSHLEFFKSLSVVSREKGKLILSLPKNGLAVLNADEPCVMKFRDKTKAAVLSYGFDEAADVRGTHVAFFRDTAALPIGSSFKLEYDGKSIPVRLPNIIAEHHISAALAAAAVGIFFKMNPLEVAETLRKFQSLPGRMRLFEGVHRTLLIDDTYNSSPKSLLAALKTIETLECSRRVVVLGDMLELGADSDRAHRGVAEWICKHGIHEVFLLGTGMLLAKEELERMEFPSNHLHWFSDPESLGDQLVASLREGDVVLLKGSQGMRLEKTVEMVLLEPSSARTLLCRQSNEWRNTPFLPPSSSLLA
ncbi:MAG: UDP-N-acetylmuramoyl-tripeptide--D-alanyl-D-alanine ligase [Candidatus Moraniibacteriota bacterium]|nr:MAG: UDP-N-acetylmuramoyl-tripeptide--D-alanyl-D-alanine ligase [Candidatus Moranbacteria bacterium]